MSSSPNNSGARAIHLTPSRLYSRYMLGAYLRHTMMVSAALMTIALTIDLWPQIALFSGEPLHVVTGIAKLALLRRGWTVPTAAAGLCSISTTLPLIPSMILIPRQRMTARHGLSLARIAHRF